jgi:hypothetical protein
MPQPDYYIEGFNGSLAEQNKSVSNFTVVFLEWCSANSCSMPAPKRHRCNMASNAFKVWRLFQ